MKRKWAYLGALLPLTSAVSASVTGSGGEPYDESNKLLRSKSGTSEEGEGHAADKQGEASEGNGAGVGIQAPSGAAIGDEAARQNDLDGITPSAQSSDPNVQVYLPPSDASMYASNDGGGMPALKGSGGSPVSITRSSTSEQTDTGETPTTPTTPEDTGYVESDPTDEHSMLIFLGGMAEGEGEGATSNGEVVFDVVDYGAFTVGYGYATYSAEGSEGAEADAFYSVYGADLVFTYREDDESGNSDSSSVYVLAIDFEGDLTAEQQAGLSSLNWLELLGQGPFKEAVAGEEGEPVSIKGNIADVNFNALIEDDHTPDGVQFSSLVFDNLGSAAQLLMQSEQAGLSIHVEAQGIDTMVLSEGTLLEIEDQFSAVAGAATIIA